MIAWQLAHDFPFEFSTEASINLADDAELLELMRKANFFAVFVGIESPDPATLMHMKKKQNTRRNLADSIHKIYDAGIYVTAGFIVGFDSEKVSIADAKLGRSGANDGAIGAAPAAMDRISCGGAAPGARSEQRGHRQQRGKFCSSDVVSAVVS